VRHRKVTRDEGIGKDGAGGGAKSVRPDRFQKSPLDPSPHKDTRPHGTHSPRDEMEGNEGDEKLK
jgi:hypothetical protein